MEKKYNEIVDRLVAMVDEMRSNSEDMKSWKNIEIAKKFFEIVRNYDDPEETPRGKALALDAMCEQLPEYNTPRLVLSIRQQELEYLEQSKDEDPGKHPTVEDISAKVNRLKDYIDTEKVSYKEYIKKYNCFLEFDHIERTPEWEEIYCDVEEECDKRLADTPRGMGFCFSYWSTLRSVLSKRGIKWHSPADLNPHVHFD